LTLYEVALLTVAYRTQQARADRRAAFAGWLLVNINRDTEKRAEPFALHEVVSWLGHGFQREAPAATPVPPPQERQSAEELMERLMAMKMMNDAFHQHGPEGNGAGGAGT